MAKKALSLSDLEAANSLYGQACFYLQCVSNDDLTDNCDRAVFLESMIACKNNGAMTNIKLKNFKEAAQMSRDALLLLDSIYMRKGLKVHGALQKMGLTDHKLFHEWRVKSLTYSAQASAELSDFKLAVSLCERGISLTDCLEDLRAAEKKLKKLMEGCKQRIEREAMKERKAAKAMFGGGSKGKKVVAKKAKAATVGKQSKDDAAVGQKGVTTVLPEIAAKSEVRLSKVEDNNGDRSDGAHSDTDEGLTSRDAAVFAGIGLACIGLFYFFKSRRA